MVKVDVEGCGFNKGHKYLHCDISGFGGDSDKLVEYIEAYGEENNQGIEKIDAIEKALQARQTKDAIKCKYCDKDIAWNKRNQEWDHVNHHGQHYTICDMFTKTVGFTHAMPNDVSKITISDEFVGAIEKALADRRNKSRL